MEKEQMLQLGVPQYVASRIKEKLGGGSGSGGGGGGGVQIGG